MLTLLGAGQGQNSSFDADYQAVLNYATTQGYTLPSASQQIIQNNLVLSLKAGGIWNKLDTFANFATDGSSDFALIDWKRLSLYTAVNSPTFTINEGFTGNGTSSYIDTNFNAFNDGVQYTQDDASRFIYMFNASGTAALDGKAAAGINNMARTSTSFQRINTTSGLTGGSFSFDSTKGMKSIHRTSSTTVELFNDTTQASRTATSATLNNNNQLILRSGASYGGHTISMYFNGASLVAENTAFVNAFNTYLYDINNLDSDYVAVLDTATTLGYALPTFSQIIKQNQLLIDLKSAGVWDKLDTFAVFATDGSSDFALIDWKRLTQYTAVNSPAFTTNEGFMGNGTSSYIDTNFNPATQGVNYTLNDASRYAYVFTGSAAQRFEGNLLDNNMRLGTYTLIKINSGSVNALDSAFTYTTIKGMKSIHRTSSTDVTLYNDSIGEGRTLISTDVTSENQWIFRNGGIYVDTKISMYAMGSSLITENTDFVNAFDTYLNSL